MTAYTKQLALLTLGLVALAIPPARSPAAPCFPVPRFLDVLQDLAPASPFYRDWTTFALSAWYWGRFYSVDPRLPLAISGQETRLATDPRAQLCISRHNAWGIMQCSGSRCTCRSFDTWNSGIEFVTRLLRRCYFDKKCSFSMQGPPRTTIPLIGEVYCPPAKRPSLYELARRGQDSSTGSSEDSPFLAGTVTTCAGRGAVASTAMSTAIPPSPMRCWR